MPPAILPPPLIVDQSFPRSRDELIVASGALGALAQAAQAGDLVVASTDVLEEVVSSFDWTQPEQGLLREIFVLLSQWFLQPHDTLIRLSTRNVDPPRCSHAIPASVSDADGLVELWADEAARLCSAMAVLGGLDFIGVGDALAFAGRGQDVYREDDSDCQLPLIGPTDASRLADCYEWTHPTTHTRPITVQQFCANASLIGAMEIRKPRRGSHYKVKFPRARSWVLDVNVDPIPQRFLTELEPITAMPRNVIRSVLATGVPANRQFRLPHVVLA